MKTFVRRSLCLVVFFATLAAAQDVIPLYQGTPPGSSPENYPERSYFSKLWNTDIVSNVTKPSLMVFKPSPELRNGTALVICPGGGFMALSITGEGATQEFQAAIAEHDKFRQIVSGVIPLALADGRAAVIYVRQHASEWGVSPDRVGIVGFSAGGALAADVAFHYTPEGRPAFVAPIYAGGESFKDATVPADAPPTFIAAATDDQLGLVPVSLGLYEKWTAAHKSAELHIYAKGGHGFGVRPHNLPTDHWIDRFAEW